MFLDTFTHAFGKTTLIRRRGRRPQFYSPWLAVRSGSTRAWRPLMCNLWYPQTLERIARHIFDVHGPLVERGHDSKQPCLYSAYPLHMALCSRGGAGQFTTRLDGLFGDQTYHILSGDVYTCCCGFPFSCIQLLAVHIMSC